MNQRRMTWRSRRAKSATAIASCCVWAELLGSRDPAIESALKSIQDVERLERMAEAILAVKSWEELLSTP